MVWLHRQDRFAPDVHRGRLQLLAARLARDANVVVDGRGKRASNPDRSWLCFVARRLHTPFVVQRTLPFALLFALFASCGGLGDAIDPNRCRDSYCVGGDVTVSYTGIFAPQVVDLVVVLDDAVPPGPHAPVLEQALRQTAGYLTDAMNSGTRGIDLNVALVPAAYTATSPPLWPASPSCPQPSGPFLHASQMCDAPSNFAGELGDALACAALAMAPSGVAARPLDALHAILAPAGAGGGFRRPDAFLAVVLVSTSDDPNLATPAEVARQHDYLRGLVVDPDYALTVAVVAPASAQGLVALASSFGDNAWFSDVEASSWPALPNTAEYFTWREWWPSCVDATGVDTDPNTDGIQLDCVATELDVSASTRTEAVIPRCPDSGTAAEPCWKVVHDTNRCPVNGLEFLVGGARPQCMPSYAVRYSLTCAVRYDPQRS